MDLYTNEEGEINLIELFYLIRSKLWLIVLFAVLSAAGVYLYSSYMITSIYTSKTQLYIINRSTEAAKSVRYPGGHAANEGLYGIS